MKRIEKAIRWLQTQLRNRAARLIVMILPALLLIAGGVLWAFGVFSTGAFSYLPERTYVLAPSDANSPETLEELLLCQDPSVDTFLKNPSIAQELLHAKSLTDIVDSRLALNNLRSIDAQLSARLKELEEVEKTAGLKAEQINHDFVATPLVAAPNGFRVTRLSLSALVKQQSDTLAQLKAVTQTLLTPPEYDDLVTLASTMNMKSVWEESDEALIHMIPTSDWLPEQGYKLYRVINGESVLIREQLASPISGLNGSLKVDDADIIQTLYMQAELTKEKLADLGLKSVSEFCALAYRTDTLTQKPRIGGETDYLKMRDTLLTVPANFDQRMSDTDVVLSQPIRVLGRQENSTLSAAALRTWVFNKFSVISDETPLGIDAFKSLPNGDAKYNLSLEVLTARQQLATLSFVDEEYASAAGFLIRDDLSKLHLEDGTQIAYVVESPNGAKSSISVTRGTQTPLSKPEGLLGYGMDGRVPLRWQQALTKEERAIISGYLIERRLNGEIGFTKITDRPIAVSYSLDETGIYFESPVFFEDTVENGRTAEYRIRALDVFGRMSEYSDTVSIKVEKVTPPNPPAIESPALSDDTMNASKAILDAANLNLGKRGIVLPIYTDASDTVRFTIYRAKSVGAEGFGAPVAIANLDYTYPDASGTSANFSPVSGAPVTKKRRFNKANQLFRLNTAAYPNLVYFDADIEEGCTYKYWVSAWDSWNNESGWSQSARVGVPTDVEPEIPAELRIAMHSRTLPDFASEPPGILHEASVSFSDLLRKDLSVRTNASGIVTGTIERAEADGAEIGTFLSGGSLPNVIDKAYDNLPEEKYIHIFLAVRGEDVLKDGTARLQWPAYAGEGLSGYTVYRAEFTHGPLNELQNLSYSEILELGLWRRVNDTAVTKNRLIVNGLNNEEGSLTLFLICLTPEQAPKFNLPILPVAVNNAAVLDAAERIADMPEGGYIYMDWDAPKDPQVSHYRVYRSEVESFKNEIDEASLAWTLVGDHITVPEYTERVEQSFAHYCYYKVTSVTPWGVESAIGTVERFRVPSTKPPQTPNLLLPLSTKNGVKVNFSAVGHCERYEIYRTSIPVISEGAIGNFLNTNPALLEALFETPSYNDAFLTGMLTDALLPNFTASTSGSPIRSLSKFRTISQVSSADIMGNLVSLGDANGRKAYNNILNEFGPLALAKYRDLSVEMMKRVLWEKVGEVSAAEEIVDPATGLLKPLSFTDTTAEYGVMYLYTVQAWNDDGLGSSRAEPVEATPRRNGPFDPIEGLSGSFENGKPHIQWNAATMPNLTQAKCRETTVGYIVYRSDTQDGTYYQASPLLFETQWTDESADPSAFNWYKVKVLDTGGYLSEFSDALSIHSTFKPNRVTVIPQPMKAAPKITIEQNFSIREGEIFQTVFGLTGTEPIEVTVEATDRPGNPVSGFIVDAASRTLSGPNSLSLGVYKVTLKAKNSVGEDAEEFLLEVKQASTLMPILPGISLNPVLPIMPLPSVSFVPNEEISGAKLHFDQATCMGFTLSDVDLQYVDEHGAYNTLNPAMLDIGYGEPVPVSILQANFEKKGNAIVISSGTVYLEKPFVLQSIGVTLVSLDLSPNINKAAVSGYVKSTFQDENLAGDLFALEFKDALLKNGNIVVKSGLPDIRYKQFTIHDIGEVWISLNIQKTGSKAFISLVNSGVTMKSHLETLDNEGLEFEQATLLTFDLEGKMSGMLYAWDEQCLQLIVPGGAALRVEAATIEFLNGNVKPVGTLVGKLVIPFERHDVYGEGVPAVYAGSHPNTNEMDELAAGKPITGQLKPVLYSGLLNFGDTVQQNGLLILPDDFALQDKCASVPIELHTWDGEGFLIESSYMTPARVTERSLTIEKQRTQAIVVSPSSVRVDLDRDGYLAKKENAQTLNETEQNFWVGLVVEGGTLTLPPDFIKSKEGEPIDFTLAEGELIYDLNGFNYQTYLYNDDGVPAKFGDTLGGFDDVLVYDCMLDLYANKVNLEINAEVAVDLFLKNRVKVKLYTNEEDNADGKAGEFLCSVAPTVISNALAEGIDLHIDAGWLREDGMHIGGSMPLAIDEIIADEALPFTDMIVPADINDTHRDVNQNGTYAMVELDRPVNVYFRGFSMQVNALDLAFTERARTVSVNTTSVRLTLKGMTELAKNIPLSAQAVDALTIECPSVLHKPVVLYEESYAVLNAGFDGCVDVSGVLVPKKVQGEKDLVEYDTSMLTLTFLQQLNALPVKSETRFGYDMEKNRCYFAIGLVPDGSGAPISFGGGEIRNFTGITAYNMDVASDNRGRYQFPSDAGQMESFIKNMQVYKGDGTSFAAGIHGEMVVAGLCDIRELYFGFESGPVVTAGGELYLPLDIGAMVGAGNYTFVGSAAITYSHPERYFSFSMTINEIDVAIAKVSGSLGFEYSPRLFGVYLGYPETLSGNFIIFRVGMGLGLRIDQDGVSLIQAKMEFGLEKSIKVAIVYLKGYLYAGVDGAYYFDSDKIALELYLKGGINGGIKVGSKSYNIIGFYLDARGKLEAVPPYNAWDLRASCKVSYSLDLWVTEIEGSVNASFDTSIA
ncbi:MAG TPA: hypothetical protein VN608_10015 [Clostridia bacterium]|nr:hypothetical protein [Clostridia bacterium]